MAAQVAAQVAGQANLCCAFTGKLMIDPVRASDGLVYERATIQHFIDAHLLSPVSSQPLTEHLEPMDDIRQQLDEFRAANIETADVMDATQPVIDNSTQAHRDNNLGAREELKFLNPTRAGDDKAAGIALVPDTVLALADDTSVQNDTPRRFAALRDNVLAWTQLCNKPRYIPVIAMFGGGNVGKSAVANSVLGFPFFPQDAGETTVVPIRVQLRRCTTPSFSIAQVAFDYLLMSMPAAPNLQVPQLMRVRLGGNRLIAYSVNDDTMEENNVLSITVNRINSCELRQLEDGTQALVITYGPRGGGKAPLNEVIFTKPAFTRATLEQWKRSFEMRDELKKTHIDDKTRAFKEVDKLMNTIYESWGQQIVSHHEIVVTWSDPTLIPLDFVDHPGFTQAYGQPAGANEIPVLTKSPHKRNIYIAVERFNTPENAGNMTSVSTFMALPTDQCMGKFLVMSHLDTFYFEEGSSVHTMLSDFAQGVGAREGQIHALITRSLLPMGQNERRLLSHVFEPVGYRTSLRMREKDLTWRQWSAFQGAEANFGLASLLGKVRTTIDGFFAGDLYRHCLEQTTVIHQGRVWLRSQLGTPRALVNQEGDTMEGNDQLRNELKAFGAAKLQELLPHLEQKLTQAMISVCGPVRSAIYKALAGIPVNPTPDQVFEFASACKTASEIVQAELLQGLNQDNIVAALQLIVLEVADTLRADRSPLRTGRFQETIAVFETSLLEQLIQKLPWDTVQQSVNVYVEKLKASSFVKAQAPVTLFRNLFGEEPIAPTAFLAAPTLCDDVVQLVLQALSELELERCSDAWATVVDTQQLVDVTAQPPDSAGGDPLLSNGIYGLYTLLIEHSRAALQELARKTGTAIITLEGFERVHEDPALMVSRFSADATKVLFYSTLTQAAARDWSYHMYIPYEEYIPVEIKALCRCSTFTS
eukprot:m.116521 g.116521  ORF g.116521 m.116521 type:complete len:930 (+) comp13613_c0_seq4:238-3027(+)